MSIETLRRWITEKEYSEISGKPLPTIRNQRSMKKGCPFYRHGRAIRYRLDEVLLHCESGRVETER